MNANGYLVSLTWLRAFAAFLVIVSHSVAASRASYTLLDSQADIPIFNFLDLGTFAVYLFFGLSGATLYISNSEKVQHFSHIIPYYKKRFFRIWPLFAISIFVYIVFIEFFRLFYNAGYDLWIANLLNEYTFINVLQYLSLTFNITGPKWLFNGPYWSLPVEFQYYLILPFVLFLMKKNKLAFIAPILFGGIFYLIYTKQLISLSDNSVFKMGFVFFGGVLLGRYYTLLPYRISLIFSLSLFSLMVLFMGLLQTKTVIIPQNIPFFSDKWNTFGIAALICIFLALITEIRIQENKFVALIHSYGTVSYSIYLFHMIFVGIGVLLCIYFEIFGNIKLIFILIFSLIMSYLVSIMTYKYIELPFISLGRKF